MTEETQEPVEQVEEVQEPQLSAIEQEAMSMGWKPKENWEGDPNEWRDARSFVDRGQLLNTIHQLKRSQRDTYQAMQDMKNMLAGAEAKGKEAALAELKADKIRALENGEYKKVADLDEQIAKTASAPVSTTDTTLKDPYMEYAEEWIPQNPWFKDEELQGEFETIIRGYVHKEAQRLGKAPDPETAFAEATKRVKRMYPEKFTPKKATQTVASARTTTSATQSKPKVKWSDLPESVQKSGTRLIRSGAFSTREEYIEAAIKSGVIQNV